MEMLVAQLFDEDSDDDGSQAQIGQKNPIKKALRDAIRENVSDADYLDDIEVIVSRLFWRTAKDKTGRLLDYYSIPYDKPELDAFIDVRNSVTHVR